MPFYLVPIYIDRSDEPCWALSSTGYFTVSSAYESLKEATVSRSTASNGEWNLLGNGMEPNVSVHFSFSVYMNTFLPIKNESADICQMIRFVSNVDRRKNQSYTCWRLPICQCHLVETLTSGKPYAVLHVNHIGMWRNSSIFEDKLVSMEEHLNAIFSLALVINNAYCIFGDSGGTNTNRREEVLIGWSSPPAGWLALNSDGAYRKSIEMRAAAWELGYRKIDLQVDSELVVQAITSPLFHPCSNSDIIHVIIQQLLRRQWEVST
ncbi:Uncharacterized protein TCM_041505 [Theobroma cacao]|uniref:RNase H type-1 domain-containing protein n=1 Tax=Theobroma cacao TaxID=3641 RepID=A0A061GZS8_THECC|nr:Uncharacterized protein TCM_041505 [Theobroma cacao]